MIFSMKFANDINSTFRAKKLQYPCPVNVGLKARLEIRH